MRLPAILAAALLAAAPGPELPAPAHGGAVLASGAHVLEVVFDDAGLHVVPRTPVPPAAAARVILRARRQEPEEAALAPIRRPDGSLDHWMLTRDFSGVPDGSRKATIRLEGLGSAPVEVSLVLRRPPPGSRAGSDHSMAGSHSDHAAAGSDHSMAGSHSDHASPGRAERLQDVQREVEARAGQGR